jgi:tyrosine-protein phosphatase SIW14
VAVVRKLSGWELPNIIDEYKAYAGTKVRDCDIKYITGFNLSQVSNVLVRESNFRYRVKNFFRMSLFAFFVLFIWLLSSAKIVTGQRRLRNIKL